MAVTTLGRSAPSHGFDWSVVFGRRLLHHYPTTTKRSTYLGIVVLTTVVLYYLYYVEGAVTPLMLPGLHMSFRYFMGLLVVSNAIGAFSAWIGGLADRIGRANLTIYGTLVVGLLQLVAIPHITTKLAFAVAYSAIGFVEGIILVSTPALIRDFSPQMGRASAMGFWALGPTLGSLAASEVATQTLPHLHPWQDQFVISGLVSIAVVLVAFVGLRELAPELRDQLMRSERERALIEARAKGIDVEAALEHPIRRMLRPDLVASSLGISLFLLIYYASVSVLTLYWVVVFSRSTGDANGINTWYWAFDAAFLVIVGFVSDRLGVRKPFMVLGAIGGMIMTGLLIAQAGHPHTGYYGNVVIVVLLGISIALAYTPWMASYTERVEAHNPALAATGLAIWGWLLRLVVAASFLVMPLVITTSNTIVDNQDSANALQAISAAAPYVPSTAPGAAVPKPAPAAVLNGLRQQVGAPGAALANLVTGYDGSHNLLAAFGSLSAADQKQIEGLLAFQPLAARIQAGQSVTSAEVAGVSASSPQLAALLRAEQKLVPAQKGAAPEWKRWWWVSLGGQAVFLVIVLAMRGRWSPRAARRERREYEAKVDAELARLHREAAASAGAAAL
jgi:MFS family permease